MSVIRWWRRRRAARLAKKLRPDPVTCLEWHAAKRRGEIK